MRPPAGNREHIAHRGIRDSDAARSLSGVIDDAGVQCQKLIVAAPVEREVLHFALANQTLRLGGARVQRRSAPRHGDLFPRLTDLENQIDDSLSAQIELYAAARLRAEVRLRGQELVAPDRQGGERVAAFAVGDRPPHRAALGIRRVDGGGGDRRAGSVADRARQGRQFLRHGRRYGEEAGEWNNGGVAHVL